MMRTVAVSAAVAIAATVGVTVAEEVKSGLQPGASAPAYDVLDVTGPDKGRKLCLR